MSVDDIEINPIRRRFAAGALFLVSFDCAGFLLSSESSATDQVLNLTATRDHYFLGPYLYYLEDSQKNLTIYSSQIGSAIEVILLQLALADRIKTLSQDQDRIKHSLSLAREVQQSLLPHKRPEIDGLDIAGRSVYCDETGGDYYDYIYSGQGKNKKKVSQSEMLPDMVFLRPC